MLTLDQAFTAQAGEVMIAMPGSPKLTTAMTDQGRPVNHHLEVAVTDKATGAPRRSPMPRITITDPATGRSRTLPAVVGMYDLTKGERDVHFGNNGHLADGAYTITVSVGGERAVLKTVVVGRP